eukprot:superscaffoldBa00000219_g2845
MTAKIQDSHSQLFIGELRESTDPLMRNAYVSVQTGRKWQASIEVDKTISSLQHQEIVGRGLGWGEAPKATKKERKAVVVEEVTRAEQELYKIKAVAQGRQGCWTTWAGTLNRSVSWAELWKIPQARLSFLLRATHDTLPYPRNLHQWFGKEESYPLCNTPNASLKHIDGSTTGSLGSWLTFCRQAANNNQPTTKTHPIQFVRPGESMGDTSSQSSPRCLSPGKDWQIMVNIGKQLHLSPEITTTPLWPDIVLWSTAAKNALLIELTIPWEEGMQAANERKRAKYSDLAVECREAGWTTIIYP